MPGSGSSRVAFCRGDCCSSFHSGEGCDIGPDRNSCAPWWPSQSKTFVQKMTKSTLRAKVGESKLTRTCRAGVSREATRTVEPALTTGFHSWGIDLDGL